MTLYDSDINGQKPSMRAAVALYVSARIHSKVGRLEQSIFPSSQLEVFLDENRLDPEQFRISSKAMYRLMMRFSQIHSNVCVLDNTFGPYVSSILDE